MRAQLSPLCTATLSPIKPLFHPIFTISRRVSFFCLVEKHHNSQRTLFLLSILCLFYCLCLMMKNKFSSYELHFFCYLLLPALVFSHNHGNPANDIVDIINNNRTDQKLPHLNDSPGLGCMALQYVELCKGNCTDNNVVNCKPPDDDFTEVFAPNCGVELPTFGSITGHIVSCQRKYLEPSLAFSQVLVTDKKSLSLLRNKSHTEVGVGLVGLQKGPFFWCVLFSNGKTNSTFVLENRGAGIKQKKGCYSGSSTPCSGGQKNNVVLLNIFSMCYVFILLFTLL